MPLEVESGECLRCCKNALAHVALPVSIAIWANFNRFKSTACHNAKYAFAKVRLHCQQPSTYHMLHKHAQAAQETLHCSSSRSCGAHCHCVSSYIILLVFKTHCFFSIFHPGPQGCRQRIASWLHASGGSKGPAQAQGSNKKAKRESKHLKHMTTPIRL